jgi:hypothetical protein
MISKTKKPEAATPATDRHDAVFVRVSTGVQDESTQRDNIANQLKNRGITVHPDYWFSCVVPRSNVAANAAFIRLMELVKAGQIGTVYIESQKRWGTKDNRELLPLLNFFSENDTRLFDLHQGLDLAGEDDLTELRVVLGGQDSKKERDGIARQSLRGRVLKFQATDSWPNGCQPFGFGKEVYTPGGLLLWRFDPVTRTTGTVTEANASGKLAKADPNAKVEKIKKKQKGEITKLVPSTNKQHVKTVQLIFDYYTRMGLTRRGISQRLNEEGRLYYDKPFTHSLVGEILENAAYVGDTHFGKSKSGTRFTFEANWEVVEAKRGAKKAKRSEGELLVKQKTHTGLIDRKTWTLAQKKLASEKERTTYAPKNPAYYLKTIFVCGHCGKNMTGRMENGDVVYVCSTYAQSSSAGQKQKCGYHRIRHDVAEKLLLDKIAEHELNYDDSASDAAREAMRSRQANIQGEDKTAYEQWQKWLDEGLAALVSYLERHFPKLKGSEIEQLKQIADHFYFDDYNMPDWGAENSPITLAKLQAAIAAAETAAANDAADRLAKATADHARLTKLWIDASELQAPIFKQQCDQLETEIKKWKPLATPLSERFKTLAIGDKLRDQQIKQLREEWPTLEALEKGEAFRRLFQTVTLLWDCEFIPASDNPTRERQTDRPGRNRYTLQLHRTGWQFSEFQDGTLLENNPASRTPLRDGGLLQNNCTQSQPAACASSTAL